MKPVVTRSIFLLFASACLVLLSNGRDRAGWMPEFGGGSQFYATASAQTVEWNSSKIIDEYAANFRQKYLPAKSLCLDRTDGNPLQVIEACSHLIQYGGDGLAYGVAVLKTRERALAHIRRARAHLAAVQGLRAALADFDRAVALLPDEPDGYRARGHMLATSENPLFIQRALPDLEKLVRLAPRNPVALRNLALAEVRVGNGETALRQISRAIDMQMEAAQKEHAKNPGNFKRVYTQPDDVQPTGEEAERINRRSLANLLISRAAIRLAADRFAAAGTDYDQAITIDPEQADAHAGAAMSYYAASQPRSAIESLTRAIALAPAKPEFRLWRAGIHLREGAYRLALSDLYDALARFDPASQTQNLLTAYQWRALSFHHAKQHAQGLADCVKVITINQGNDVGLCSNTTGVGTGDASYFDSEFSDIRRRMVFYIHPIMR